VKDGSGKPPQRSPLCLVAGRCDTSTIEKQKENRSTIYENGERIVVLPWIGVNICFLPFMSPFPARFPNTKGGGGGIWEARALLSK